VETQNDGFQDFPYKEPAISAARSKQKNNPAAAGLFFADFLTTINIYAFK
jgi:hypothetical protein